eukprot:COSAG02_NODE_8677_length_2483_cov_2.950084_4_plen_52_part_01
MVDAGEELHVCMRIEVTVHTAVQGIARDRIMGRRVGTGIGISYKNSGSSVII